MADDNENPVEIPSSSHDADEWKNRTAMAWFALSAIVVLTLLLFYTVDLERVKVISEFITWFYLGMTSIVGAYMGLKTWVQTRKL